MTFDMDITKAMADAFDSPRGERADNLLAAWREAEIEAVEGEASAEDVRRNLADRFFDYLSGVAQKSAIKRENGLDFPPRDYAYVPDPALPSGWKLRLTETPGKVTVAQLGRAAAALGAGGFRGNRVDIPAAALSAVKRRIRAEYRKLGVRDDQIPAAVKEGGQFNVWKQADGRLRWLAVYSNCFRDNDYPPEIISKESHELYVEMVDAGVVDFPELWHYHIPGTAWGKADWVGFADGFALASGTVYEGHEKEAEALMARDDIGVSHGMPLKYILRDESDPSVITMHVTTEISPLPMDAAANKLTGFFIKEHDEMPLSPQKKQHLLDVGFGEDVIARLETGLKEAADAAVEAGIESKETNGADVADPVTEAAAEVKEGEAIEQVAEPVVLTEVGETPAFLSVEDAQAAFLALGNTLGEFMQTVNSRLDALATEVKAANEQRAVDIAALKETTPALSLADLTMQAVFGTKSAEVDGRSALAKSKPAETKQKAPSVTGVSFLDGLFVQNGQGE